MHPCAPSRSIDRLAIVSAMPEEGRALLRELPAPRVETVAGREFVFGELDGRGVVLVLCGIGKVAAATTTALLLDRFAVDALLFTGVAGGLASGVEVGDVVVADALLQHDMDASPLFPRWEVPFTGRSRFPTDAALSGNLSAAASEALARRGGTASLHRGLVVSGDRFVATAAESARLREALPDALAVEMEGAAVAQVCADFRRRFAVLRTVSDRADDAAHVDFGRFVAEVAAGLSHDIVRATLRRL